MRARSILLCLVATCTGATAQGILGIPGPELQQVLEAYDYNLEAIGRVANHAKYAPLAVGAYGSREVSGWTILPYTVPNDVGFEVTVYQNDATGEIVVAFAGTNDRLTEFGKFPGVPWAVLWPDWTTNFELESTPIGQIAHARLALQIAADVTRDHENVTFVGDSAGGAWASLSAAYTGNLGVTFNSAPLRTALQLEIIYQAEHGNIDEVNRFRAILDYPNIVNFRDMVDPLTFFFADKLLGGPLINIGNSWGGHNIEEMGKNVADVKLVYDHLKALSPQSRSMALSRPPMALSRPLSYSEADFLTLLFKGIRGIVQTASTKIAAETRIAAARELNRIADTSAALQRAIFGFPAFAQLAKSYQDIGMTEKAAHSRAAYEWAYFVGNVEVAMSLRLPVEGLQLVVFSFGDALDRLPVDIDRVDFFDHIERLMGQTGEPIDVNAAYFQDMAWDLWVTHRGASDAARGLPSNFAQFAIPEFPPREEARLFPVLLGLIPPLPLPSFSPPDPSSSSSPSSFPPSPPSSLPPSSSSDPPLLPLSSSSFPPPPLPVVSSSSGGGGGGGPGGFLVNPELELEEGPLDGVDEAVLGPLLAN